MRVRGIMSKETMTSKERWLAVLNRQKPDRIPMDYWATAETTEKLMQQKILVRLRMSVKR